MVKASIYKPLLVSILGNSVLSLLKLCLGFHYSSISLISDGIHSLSDAVTSVIGYYGLKLSSKPPDKTHPFGHSRFEPFVAFLLGELLLIASYEIGRDSIFKLMHGKAYIKVNLIMLGVLVLSIVSKEIMTRYALKIGKKLKNQIIIADAYHHRSDALSSLVAFIGLLAQKSGFYYGDALSGLLVAIFLVKASLDIILENVKYLTGKAPSPDVVKKVEKVALKNPYALGVHGLKAHYVGPKIQVEIHVEVPKNIPLEKAHDVAHRIKEEIEKIKEVDKSFVHIDPIK